MAKGKRRKRHDTLILRLIVMVAVVLVVFEGRLVTTMIGHSRVMGGSVEVDDQGAVTADKTAQAGGSGDSKTASQNKGAGSVAGSVLAGLPSAVKTASSGTETEAQQENYQKTVSNPDSAAIVPAVDEPVDDSYFSDAAFIGDSRMQGFQNASGITQGRFFTSVGMSLTTMKNDAVIPSGDGGKITVAAALSGAKYNKIYVMLGANDLGEYDWDSFRDGFISCMQRFQEIQPDALIYICSCIYVDEAKVTSGSYVNNANVDKINSILLEICETEGYHYLDLNEILSNGYGALKEDASSDGVHLYEKYCKQMLDYLKNHYVTGGSGSEKETEALTEGA